MSDLAVTRRGFLKGAVATAGVLVLPVPGWMFDAASIEVEDVVWPVVTVTDVDQIDVYYSNGKHEVWTADSWGGPVSTAAGDFTAQLPRPANRSFSRIEVRANGTLVLERDM